MNNTAVIGLTVSLLAFPSLGHAGDEKVNPVAQPVLAYDEHKVKHKAHEVQEDQEDLIHTKAELKTKEATVDKSQTAYKHALRAHGADSPAAKKAKSEYSDARRDYVKARSHNHDAHHAIKKDASQLQKAQNALNETKLEEPKKE